MIRSPLLPPSRESLWALVSAQLDAVERGLTLVLQGLDVSGGQVGQSGPIDGLARDAAGAPVLVLLATDGDAQLPARVLAAADFLHRVGDGLARALPEAALCPTASGRVLVVGAGVSGGMLEQLSRITMPGLWVCRLEPFRAGAVDRFAVRWLASERSPAAMPGVAIDTGPSFAAASHHDAWTRLLSLCSRIDDSVHVDGDRYWRRITWCGRLLAEIRIADGALHGAIGSEAPRVLGTPREHRTFADRLLRRYLQCAGLEITPPDAPTGARGNDAASRHAAPAKNGSSRVGGEDLRSTMAAARLSPEEYSALGDPASAAGGEAEGAATADDGLPIVAARESSWLPPGRAD